MYHCLPKLNPFDKISDGKLVLPTAFGLSKMLTTISDSFEYSFRYTSLEHASAQDEARGNATNGFTPQKMGGGGGGEITQS